MPVNTRCKEYLANYKKWKLVRDCIDGDDAIKAGGVTYLPRLSDQSDNEYSAYQERAVFFDATSRTAEGLHGHIFAKDPVQTGNVSERIKELLKNVDGTGKNIDLFADDTGWDAMPTGWGGTLVDHPVVAKGTSLADKKGGAFLKWYEAESIINWRHSVIDGVSKLSFVVLREDRTAQGSDAFETVTVERYRVLTYDENGNYIQQIFEKNDKAKDGFIQTETITPTIGGNPLKEIPFFTGPGKKPQKSMLYGLAKENIGHYKKTADYENGLHLLGCPTPIVENMQTPTAEKNGKKVPAIIKLGASVFQFFFGGPNTDVRVKFLEFTGTGLGELLKALNGCLDRMAKLGIQAIGSEKKGVETAEVAQIHRSSENGVLGAFARNMSDMITQAVRLMMIWNGISEEEANGWSYELNTNYNHDELSAQILQIMHSARQSNEVPRIVWFNAVKRAGYIPENMTYDVFLQEIERDQAGGHGPDAAEAA